MRELAELEETILAAAEVDVDKVAETVISAVAGPDAADALPDDAKRILSANGPAILAELRGGYPEVTLEQLGSIDQPTLLVGSTTSK